MTKLRCTSFLVETILGSPVFGLDLISSFQLFSQSLHNRGGKPSILRVQPNIYPTIENNAGFFFEKVFLKGTSPADHSLQQQKTVIQLANRIFSFGCLRISLTVYVTIYNSKCTERSRINYYQAQDLVSLDKQLSC